MHSHFVSYLGFCSTEEDQIHNRTTLHIPYPILSMPCLLMPWRHTEPGTGRLGIEQISRNILSLASEDCLISTKSLCKLVITSWERNTSTLKHWLERHINAFGVEFILRNKKYICTFSRFSKTEMVQLDEICLCGRNGFLSQHHCYGWLGDLRSQGISSFVLWIILVSVSERLKLQFILFLKMHLQMISHLTEKVMSQNHVC